MEILDVVTSSSVKNKFKTLDPISLTSTAYLNGSEYSKGKARQGNFIYIAPFIHKAIQCALQE